MNSDILLSEDKTELCLDEARRMLHISKRKCAELLRKGILPCTSTGKKTRQYRILRSDVEALRDTKDHKKPSEPPKDYREQLEDLWYDAPDVLAPSDVQKLTGYSQSYVSSWMVTGKLKTVTVHGSPITSREWLIDFMCRDLLKLNDLRLDNTRRRFCRVTR
jgi:hypothetical protein